MKCFLNLFFLLLIPLSEGVWIQLTMPSQIALGSTGMKVTCNLIKNDTLVGSFNQVSLLHGRHETIAKYMPNTTTYEILFHDRISIEVIATMTNISLTFVFSYVTCRDFSTFKCRGYESTGTVVDSEENILKVLPTVDRITYKDDLYVNHVTRFMCIGTIDKDGPYSVKWYRNTISPSNRMYSESNIIISKTECSRRVSSAVIYVIEEKDITGFILWCQIQNNYTSAQSQSFNLLGSTARLSMPSYFKVNSLETLNVKCDFKSAYHLGKISLLHRGTETVATYIRNESKYQLDGYSIGVSLNNNWNIQGTDTSLIFSISGISCRDFSWYSCRGYGINEIVNSEIKTLKVFPTVDTMRKVSLSNIAVNQTSTFMCIGTISNDDPYSVRWYQFFKQASNRIYSAENEIISQNQCSRKISSVVKHYVTRDFLMIGCQIKNGESDSQFENFSARGARCNLEGSSILVVMVLFLASAFHHF